jgi:hypothetical protein
LTGRVKGVFSIKGRINSEFFHQEGREMYLTKSPPLAVRDSPGRGGVGEGVQATEITHERAYEKTEKNIRVP